MWEPGEVLASTEVTASKAEVTSIKAQDVAEFPTVGEEIREEFESSIEVDVSKDMVANVVVNEFGSSLMLAGAGVNAKAGESAGNEVTVQEEQDIDERLEETTPEMVSMGPMANIGNTSVEEHVMARGGQIMNSRPVRQA